jgi:prepilin-type processing-associated H-X9-DG protein
LSAHGARAAVRLSDEYFLRALRIVADLTEGDMITAIVFRAVVAGNIGYLDGHTAEAALYADLETVPPDHLRRPVSILSVSGALGLPYETTRRHVRKLIASGRCRMERAGVIAPAESLVGPAEEAAILANLANLRRLFRGLKRAGVELE